MDNVSGHGVMIEEAEFRKMKTDDKLVILFKVCKHISDAQSSNSRKILVTWTMLGMVMSAIGYVFYIIK